MTDAQRAYMRARERVQSYFVRPAQDLLDAARDLCADANARADRAETALEVLRPVWAQGHTSDSQAAQSNGNALGALWRELGATNQTEAMAKLRALTARPAIDGTTMSDAIAADMAALYERGRPLLPWRQRSQSTEELMCDLLQVAMESLRRLGWRP